MPRKREEVSAVEAPEEVKTEGVPTPTEPPREVTVPAPSAPTAEVEKEVVLVKFEKDAKSPIPRWPFLVCGNGPKGPLEPMVVMANDGGEAISRYCLVCEPPIREPASCQFDVRCQDDSRMATANERKAASRKAMGLPVPA